MFLPIPRLSYNEKMSIAASTEVRVQFVDWEFVEWVAMNVDAAFMIRSGVGKYILRKAMVAVVPPEVLRQGRTGFGAPAGHWIRHDLRGMGSLLSSEAVIRRGFLKSDEVQRLSVDHYRGRMETAYSIWQLLTLEPWFRDCIDTPSE